MSLSRHLRSAPIRFLSVFHLAARACGPKASRETYRAGDLSDMILSDIGVSRCMLMVGVADGWAD